MNPDTTKRASTFAQLIGLQLKRRTRKLTKLQFYRYRPRQASCAQHTSQSAKERQCLPQAARQALPLPSSYVLSYLNIITSIFPSSSSHKSISCATFLTLSTQAKPTQTSTKSFSAASSCPAPTVPHSPSAGSPCSHPAALARKSPQRTKS